MWKQPRMEQEPKSEISSAHRLLCKDYCRIPLRTKSPQENIQLSQISFEPVQVVTLQVRCTKGMLMAKPGTPLQVVPVF